MLHPLLVPVVFVLLFAGVACGNDCDEVWANCTRCGERLGYSEGQLSYRCPRLDDADACEEILELNGGCAFVDEDQAEVCGDCREE